MDYGMDYQGGGGGGGGGFQNSSQSGGRSGGGGNRGPRRAHNEQTMIPITIKMALESEADGGNLQLADGRKVYHVKLIAATRSVEDFSTNALYTVEDGTGLIEVKQWLDEADCTAIANLRQQTLKENTYLKITGQIKDYDGKKMIVADSIRPLSTGNQLAHHFLEVVYAEQMSQRQQSFVPSGGIGFTAPLSVSGVPLQNSNRMHGGGEEDTLRESLVLFIKERAPQLEHGVSGPDCVRHLSSRYSEAAVHKLLNTLLDEGHVYTTIDENHYMFAE